MAEDIIYINWLNMARAGLMGLEFYTPETKKWRQAHMCARFVILRVMLEAGGGLVALKRVVAADGRADVLIELDRAKVDTVGRKAVGDFLMKLQVYKSFGDAVGGTAMYTSYSDVPDDFLELRAIVMERKRPRQMFVQPHTRLQPDGSVELANFAADAKGMIESFVARFGLEFNEPLAMLAAAEAEAHTRSIA